MRNTINIVILFTFLMLIGCNENVQKSVSQNDRLELVPEPDRDLREKYEQQQENSLKSGRITKKIDCKEYSKVMMEFIEILKQDNYAINLRENQAELSFKSFKEEFQVDRYITFSKDNIKTIFAERKNKLEKMADNWYPSFSVIEICFINEQEASKSYQVISDIIDNSDVFNEKDYDYILKNGKKLIYVRSVAKIFEKYAFGYRESIKGLIKNKKD